MNYPPIYFPPLTISYGNVEESRETPITPKRGRKSSFSPEQDAALIEAIKFYGKDWKKVEKHVNEKCEKQFGRKNIQQLSIHYSSFSLETKFDIESKGCKKRSQAEAELFDFPQAKKTYSLFTPEQERALLEVYPYGQKPNWQEIAHQVNLKCAAEYGIKTRIQCREHFNRLVKNNPTLAV